MNDNQKIVIISITICSIILLWISIVQSNKENKVNYNYYVTTDSIEKNFEYFYDYKISKRINPIIENQYVRLGLSALLDYNLNIKSTTIYSGAELFDNIDNLSNDFIITTAINTLYKSNQMLSILEEEREENGADYKVSSISVERTIKFLFGNIEYDKKIITDEIYYNEESDIYYYKLNEEISSIGNNHVKFDIESASESEDKIEVNIIIAYLNYDDNKVYYDSKNEKIILDELIEENIFLNKELYPHYKLIFTKQSNETFIFDSIKKI